MQTDWFLQTALQTYQQLYAIEQLVLTTSDPQQKEHLLYQERRLEKRLQELSEIYQAYQIEVATVHAS